MNPRSMCVACGAAAFLSACGAAAQPAVDEAFSITPVSAMVKVLQSDNPGAASPAAERVEVHLWAARGEAESAQLAIHASQALTTVVVDTTALIGPDAAALQPVVSLVGCVPVKKTLPNAYCKDPGDLPDPLLPIQPFPVAAGTTRCLWVTVCVPLDARPGVYTGTLSVRPAGLPKRDVLITATVANVTVPRQSALHTLFFSWNGGRSKFAYGEAWNAERQQAFRQQMLDYRLSSPPQLPWDGVFSKKDGTWQADWHAFDRAVEDEMRNGVTAFLFPRDFEYAKKEPNDRKPWTFPWLASNGGRVNAKTLLDDPLAEDRTSVLRLAGEHLTAKKWSQYFHIKFFDEPGVTPRGAPHWKGEDDHGPANIENIKALARYIHDAHPGLRLIFCTTTPYYEIVALDMPVYTWMPHINQYHVDFQQKRQAMGEPNWMYICVTTRSAPSFPDNWRIDRQGTSHRAIGWWLFRYRCDGFLYWCVDYWGKYDVWQSPFLPPWEDSAGEGFLFYPNPDTSKPPLPSIRAELQRDGFEDYDLLTMLRGAVATMPAAPRQDLQLLDRARRLLDVHDVIRGRADFSEDPNIYETRHREMLEVLALLAEASRQM